MCVWFNFFFSQTVFNHACVCVCVCVSVCVCTCVCTCVYLWYIPSWMCLLHKPKEVITHAPSEWQQKQRTNTFVLFVPSFKYLYCICIDVAHLKQSLASPINLTYQRERVQMFFIFSAYLQIGTLSSDKCFPHAGWSVSVWTDLNWCYSRRNQCISLTAAITPLTSIHQEICMR